MGSTLTYRCERCEAPMLERQVGAWVHLTSCWVQLRRGGGAHGVRFPVGDGRRLCNVCMDLAGDGEQLALFDL